MGTDNKKPGSKTEMLRETPATGVPPETPLPAIAAKADDLEEIKKAVEEAASVSGGLWLSYLFVLSYVAIAAGAVTHVDLLLERPVKLPFLNVELPLLAFFAVAPFVVLIIHAYALMHFRMLGNKARQFHKVLRDTFPGKGDNQVIRGNKRRLLPSNIFVQILAGPPEHRHGIFGCLLRLTALITLVAIPVLVLLLLQIQFLPFHDATITWAQRSALFLDLVVLWLLRPPILADMSAEISRRARILSQALRGLGLAVTSIMSMLALWFSAVIATVPGEPQETALASLNPPVRRVGVERPSFGIKLITVRDLLFVGEVDETTRRRKSLFSNTLVLPGFNIYEALNTARKEHLIDLRGRHLEQAVFSGADLTKADLSGAQLQGALLLHALLRGAVLERANFHDALLGGARFEGASLAEAQLQGVWLPGAQLQGASLTGAQLQGALLLGAGLDGVSLEGARLQGAVLFRAHFLGASLEAAQLQGASLAGAQLQGASLEDAEIKATDFSGSYFWRTAWGEINPARIGAIQLQGVTWKPDALLMPSDTIPSAYHLGEVNMTVHLVQWTGSKYAELRDSMNSILEGEMRDQALKRIEILDCGNPDKTTASCDPNAGQPPGVLEWQKKLEAASIGKEDFATTLAVELQGLVCVNDANAIYILRGVGSSGRLQATGREAPALVDFIMSKDCPVSASLTDADKARLLQVKQDAEKNFPPAPASNNGK